MPANASSVSSLPPHSKPRTVSRPTHRLPSGPCRLVPAAFPQLLTNFPQLLGLNPLIPHTAPTEGGLQHEPAR
jgi:hypothetical protein